MLQRLYKGVIKWKGRLNVIYPNCVIMSFYTLRYITSFWRDVITPFWAVVSIRFVSFNTSNFLWYPNGCLQIDNSKLSREDVKKHPLQLRDTYICVCKKEEETLIKIVHVNVYTRLTVHQI